LKTEKVEIDNRYGEEYAGKYVFSEISWAKRSRIIQKHTKYHPVTGQVVTSDYIAIQAETIYASLREQPSNKPISLGKLLNEEDGIPIELGELFSKTVNRLCSLSVDETRFLSELSDEEKRTQASQSTNSALSSNACPVSSEENLQKTSKPSS